jgi:hypothetical protein
MLGTVGLALAEAGRVEEAEAVLTELTLLTGVSEGPAAAVEAAIAKASGDQKRAAEAYARAADAYEGSQDPRDVVEALIGLAVTTPDPDRRAATLTRIEAICEAGGITLLAHEKKLLTEEV